MPKRERSITKHDITTIVEIIHRFRTAPTWERIVEKVDEAGLPFKKRSLQNQKAIAEAYHKKREVIKTQRASVKTKRTEQDIPTSDEDISSLVATLRARIAQLEAENSAYIEATETILVNAAMHNIPHDILRLPINHKS